MEIRAIGHFLAYYETDLKYILEFQRFKNNQIAVERYCEMVPSGFYSFLKEYRIIRNIEQGKAIELLKVTKEWINTDMSNNVDEFASKISQQNFSKGKVLTSLSSKILFLNNPWEILPMDSQVRKSLHQTENKYSVYEDNLEKFKIENDIQIIECLNIVEQIIKLINDNFSGLDNLDMIVRNRIIDKLLWVQN